MNRYVCEKCGRKYYSAAELEHLENKNCECGGALVEADVEVILEVEVQAEMEKNFAKPEVYVCGKNDAVGGAM